MYSRLLVVGALLVALPYSPVTAQAPVDLELSLLVDVSGSVSTSEFNLQKTGYVNAFSDAALWDAIRMGPRGAIAVNLIYWSSAGQHVQAVGWTLLNSVGSTQAFADAIAATTRPFSGGTDIGAAINFATPLFFSNAYAGTRLVMDVSGDGTSGTVATRAARDAALAAGITTINGIVIGGGTSISDFYRDNVIGGTGAFVEAADTFEEFDAALSRKLFREVTDPTVVPEPGTYALLGTGLVGLAGIGAVRRRRR